MTHRSEGRGLREMHKIQWLLLLNLKRKPKDMQRHSSVTTNFSNNRKYCMRQKTQYTEKSFYLKTFYKSIYLKNLIIICQAEKINAAQEA